MSRPAGVQEIGAETLRPFFTDRGKVELDLAIAKFFLTQEGIQNENEEKLRNTLQERINALEAEIAVLRGEPSDKVVDEPVEGEVSPNGSSALPFAT